MSLLTTGSVLAAFFAGMVALFAPCCIVFLAPSYLAAAVKNRRWRLLPLTFVFAAGLALIMVPITLGISLVAGTIAKYHAPFYYAGGALMLLLAAYSLSGRMWSLPSFLRAPDTRRGDSASFFALGVFSGIASSCCAPVLAGVMTLSALSGSPVGGTMLGLAFVLGMTLPLFVMALAWDRLHLHEKSWLKARPIRIRLAGRTLIDQHRKHRGRGRLRHHGRVRHLPGRLRTDDQRPRLPGRHRPLAERPVRAAPAMALARARTAPGPAGRGHRRAVRLRHPHRPGRDRRKVADHDDPQRQTLVHADPSCHHTTSPGNAVAAEPGRTEENQS